jgi:glutamate synthase domain-containing protein 2
MIAAPMRHRFLITVLLLAAAVLVASRWWPVAAFAWFPLGLVMVVGLHDMLQTRHTILKNYPVVGHFRYWFEFLRPEINQYFVESETDGRPFSREMRSVAYQRAKDTLDTRPFGTVHDLYEEGTEWIAHSIAARRAAAAPRIPIGGSRCRLPYEASLLNVSAMSYGSLSKNAVLALSSGARAGGFAVNTGEGGISPYHLESGGDLIWQIGTGYFGCRSEDGRFSPEAFERNADHPSVRMIELKLSQGAKPGHGGILPAAKVTPEIARIRGVPLGQDVLSPPRHSAFDTPLELVEFVDELRLLSGGKPVGIKLCVGKPDEFFGICKAMVQLGRCPDFITIDGAEGGTGAAPVEFSNAVGMPLIDGLMFAHNALVGCGLRDQLKLIASGRVVTGFHLVQRMALGADLCASARAMMLALGCIQAMRCNTNACPTGITTQRPSLVRGLSVSDKSRRVRRYHHNTVESFMELLGAAGIEHPDHLRPHHLFRRISPYEVRTYAELYSFIKPRDLLSGRVPDRFRAAWEHSDAQHF